MKNRFINSHNTRKDDQKKVMDQITEDGVCPFCPENLERYHKEPIIKDGEYWILSKNQWPYDNVKHQLIGILKTHKEHISELTPQEGAELISLFSWASKEYDMPGGGVAIRFGSNPQKGDYGSSVLHLHAHLIEPDLEKLDSSFKFKFGQKNH